ncbi:TonB family protein [Pseudoxanthomonas sacheonensis]|uniref:TonB family protein n=1 Tax=Pseudoxanthomonas sacheonensis TaxID=443615 RepID=UPI003D2F79BE
MPSAFRLSQTLAAMRFFVVVLCFMVIFAASASDGLEPIYKVPVKIPPDSCMGETFTCAVTLEFVVLPDGTVSDVSIKDSSTDRACDRQTRDTVAKWRYPLRSTSVRLVRRIDSYSCPLRPRAANNSFKPKPLRGSD